MKNLTEDHGGGKEKHSFKQREENHKRLLKPDNKLRVDEEVEERGKWVMGIEEGTWDEHWVLYVSNEPGESTPKTKSTLYTLYVNQFDNKLY